MPNYQEKLLDLKNNADLLEELKLVTQADREETVKFNLALAEYLTDIYGSAKKVPSLDAEAQRRFPKEKIKLIDSFISEMRSDIDGYDENGRKPDFYILSGDRLEDAPSLLIKLMEYFCLLHKNRGQLGADDYLWYFEKRGLCDRLYIADKIDRIFVNLQEHCRVYFLNNCQYQKDDELKELLLVKDGEGFEDLYDAVMEKQIIEDAKHYKTFYETLMELAEKREEFRGNPDKLYKAAMLPDEVHNDHKYKVFEDIKKEDVIALVLTLKLDIREAEILLKAAGFQFNDSIIEKFVKSMIITQKWSCGLYNKF